MSGGGALGWSGKRGDEEKDISPRGVNIEYKGKVYPLCVNSCSRFEGVVRDVLLVLRLPSAFLPFIKFEYFDNERMHTHTISSSSQWPFLRHAIFRQNVKTLTVSFDNSHDPDAVTYAEATPVGGADLVPSPHAMSPSQRGQRPFFPPSGSVDRESVDTLELSGLSLSPEGRRRPWNDRVYYKGKSQLFDSGYTFDRSPEEDGRAFSIAHMIEKIHQAMAGRGYGGKSSVNLFPMSRVFKEFDESGDCYLRLEEFMGAMRHLKFGISDANLRRLYDHFDHGRGYFDYRELIRRVRGPISQRKVDAALRVFDILDRRKEGSIDLRTLRDSFDPSRHPLVLQGVKTKMDVWYVFLDHFMWNKRGKRGGDSEWDGKVSRKDWMEYHSDVATSFERDEDFERYMCGVWRVRGEGLRMTDKEISEGIKLGRGHPESRWTRDEHQEWMDSPSVKQLLSQPPPALPAVVTDREAIRQKMGKDNVAAVIGAASAKRRYGPPS